jgi:hypothetical protein
LLDHDVVDFCLDVRQLPKSHPSPVSSTDTDCQKWLISDP